MSHVCGCADEKMGLRLVEVFDVQDGDLLGNEGTTLGSRSE